LLGSANRHKLLLRQNGGPWASPFCPLSVPFLWCRPDLIIQASDGNFYGAAQVTDEGVSDPRGGTLFKLTPAGKFTQLFTFTQGASGFLNGNNPADGFVEANDGFLYGTTFNGGKQNDGVLFRIGKTGTGFIWLARQAQQWIPHINPTAN
jgi:uncharacterized repeat protein (TIGR03803 family)